MSFHSTSTGARLHSPIFEHASYSPAVTSWTSMQNGDNVTWCAGFSSSLPSSAPMKNLPPAILAISLGREGGGGGGAARALADADGGGASAAPSAGPRARMAKNPTAAAATAAIEPKNHPRERA